MTKQLYLQDTYLSESQAIITSISQDERGAYILLDQTIFYPQGGGQPADRGLINGEEFSVAIEHVRQNEGEIRHYIATHLSEHLIGSNVICQLDYPRRLLNSKYHTVAHLIGNVVECLYPELKAVKGHSFPNEAYIEFKGMIEKMDAIKILQVLKQDILDGLVTDIFEIDPILFAEKFYKLPYTIPSSKIFRVMQIGNYLPVPCGGTHIANISEIENIELGKIKVKNSYVCMPYRLV